MKLSFVIVLIFLATSSIASNGDGCGGSLTGLLHGDHIKKAIVSTYHTEFHCRNRGACYERIALYDYSYGKILKYELVIDEGDRTLTECFSLTKSQTDEAILESILNVDQTIHREKFILTPHELVIEDAYGGFIKRNGKVFPISVRDYDSATGSLCNPTSLTLLHYLKKGFEEGRQKSVLLNSSI